MMESQDIELQQQVPKPRNRKMRAFGRMSREEDIGEVQDNFDGSMGPSTSYSQMSRQSSGNTVIVVNT